MFEILILIAGILISLPMCFLISRLWNGFDMYQRSVKAFGRDKVRIIFKPLTFYKQFWLANTFNGYDSQRMFTKQIEQNPDIKVFVVFTINMSYMFFADPDIIKKICLDRTKQVEKRKWMIFGEQLQKGLIFSETQVWKKSRSIMSSLFHFDILKQRETIMYDVITKQIQNLENQKVDLFKLGCTIGGDIVIESLLGKQFNEIRFGELTPLEEIQNTLLDMIKESTNPVFLLRTLFIGKVNFKSPLLLPSQKRLKDRLQNIKKVGFEYLEKQVQKHQKGEKIAPFVKAYLDLNDKSYFDEIIQQLIIFLIAGQDTTGSLIQCCLYMLAKYPHYQDLILKSLKGNQNIHNNKELNNFIHQTNRLIGPLRYSLVRKVVKPFEMEGLSFKTNDSFRLGFSMSMLNVKYFDNPYQFTPDRFNSPVLHPFAFVPFSGGPHNCIGQHMSMMQVRISLSQIITNYKLDLTGEHFQMILRSFLNLPMNHNLITFSRRKVKDILL